MTMLKCGLFVLMFSLSVGNAEVSKTYRSDYVYSSRTDAFYKLHIEERRGWEVGFMCEAEGSTLMVPEHPEDISQIHGMMKQYPDLDNFVYVGSDGQSHQSAEETPIIDLSTDEPEWTFNNNICTVMTRDGQIDSMPCQRRYPFVCKVAARDARYDTKCGVYGTAYQFVSSVKSCYKIPSIALSWNEAYAYCRAEGSHLIVINSETEMQEVQNLTRSADARYTDGSWCLFVGIRADRLPNKRQGVFKTVFNQTLEQAGYSQWMPGEPNNEFGIEYCGVMFRSNGKLNDVDCMNKYGFICEKEIRN